jgi:predicted NAD-dependent protein-ADP-ribosyltransferase YbiA (DUF1768 family)
MQTESASASASSPPPVVCEPTIRFNSKMINGFTFVSNFFPFCEDSALAKIECQKVRELGERIVKSAEEQSKSAGDKVRLPQLASNVPNTPAAVALITIERGERISRFFSVEEFYQTCKWALVDPVYLKDELVGQKRRAKEWKIASSRSAWLPKTTIMKSRPATSRRIQEARLKDHFDRVFTVQVQVAVMELALLLKFSQNPVLGSALVATKSSKLSEVQRQAGLWTADVISRKTGQVKRGGDMMGKLLEKVRAILSLPLNKERLDEAVKRAQQTVEEHFAMHTKECPF